MKWLRGLYARYLWWRFDRAAYKSIMAATEQGVKIGKMLDEWGKDFDGGENKYHSTEMVFTVDRKREPR